MAKLPDALEHRKADHPILDLFVKRWSPRSMSGAPLSESELMRLFEAARWAPSTYNEQEWRFLYAMNGGAHWSTFFGLLLEANQQWCKNAAVLVVVLSHKVFTRNGNPNPVHTFDAGLASQNLLLQGAEMGLVCHGMAGFDRGKARRELKVPDDYDVEAMIAIGHPADTDVLPEKYRPMDLEPSQRKPVREIAEEGPFAF
jgi:nitroreductase